MERAGSVTNPFGPVTRC